MKDFQKPESRRWRLILGRDENDKKELLNEEDLVLDQTLDFIYGDKSQKAGLGASKPQVGSWLGDIRKYFPQTVVSMLQKDALQKLKLEQILQEEELMKTVVPDIHLAVALLSLKGAVPQKAKQSAREIVRRLAQELTRKLRPLAEQSLRGALNRAVRNARPKLNEMDWLRTLKKNLKHYQPSLKTIIPEHLEGKGRKGRAIKDLIICVDQSGSMAASVVYSGILACIMASLPALRTQLVVFDTEVVDLSEHLHDPVDTLFGTQLGGGTDITKALTYTRQLVRRPQDTTIFMVTDLFEGGNERLMLQNFREIIASGIKIVVLLSLSDQGTPSYNQNMAWQLQEMGITVMSCTPDAFPDLVAKYIFAG
ncbi:MAG: VWA domain-containing protein [Cytophagales bacterium]|nr:MAG: VWA domain-containing protein [Cytophagales bacterium]TAF61882.1 MAG: VWA domain-containing protein [Cytophagales bacterium]